MFKSRYLVPVGLLSAALAVPLPAAGCCRIEIPGGGEVKVDGGGVTVTPPPVPPIVPVNYPCGDRARCSEAGNESHRRCR